LQSTKPIRRFIDPGAKLLYAPSAQVQVELTLQSRGLLAISLGLSLNFSDGHAMLEQGMVVYDALYG
jgi:hypothetical protein